MTASGQDRLLSEVAAYYSDKLAEHGESPGGVDWNGAVIGTVISFPDSATANQGFRCVRDV